jgi:hypothetical protein
VGVGVGGGDQVVGKTEGGNALVGQSESEASVTARRRALPSCDANLRHALA